MPLLPPASMCFVSFITCAFSVHGGHRARAVYSPCLSSLESKTCAITRTAVSLPLPTSSGLAVRYQHRRMGLFQNESHALMVSLPRDRSTHSVQESSGWMS